MANQTPPADTLADQIGTLLEQGMTLGDIMDYDERDYEAVYALGHGFYGQGRYEDAMKAFGFLVMHNHWEAKYLNAFAASLQMLGRYQDAIQHYSSASLLDLSDPQPTFHTAECMIPLGMLKEAREALGLVVTQCEGVAERADLGARARAMLDILSRQG